MPARLSSKVCLVTGGASGFGAAICAVFAAEGAQVIVTDMNEKAGREMVAKFDAQGASASTPVGTMEFERMDVTSEADWKRVMDGAICKYGRVDVLVNNAGTTYRTKPTLDVTEDEFDRVINVNIKSIYLSIRAFMPQAISRGKDANGSSASVINIASIGAFRPRPNLVWYNASKAFLTNATKGLAAEYGPHGIRVNSLCPLLASTGLFESFVGVPPTEENYAKFISNVPMGRLSDTKDIALAALFYASDDSSFVTGTALEIDGGRAIG